VVRIRERESVLRSNKVNGIFLCLILLRKLLLRAHSLLVRRVPTDLPLGREWWWFKLLNK